MNQSNMKSPKGGDGAVYKLKALYESYGYSQYKMSKFEEYDLYLRNKSFLVSNHIITFTDTDGKLMALKPDVTLSIVKNSPERETGVRKVYYDENVYRVPRGAISFKEIMQAGLECIGEIDFYCIAEVLTLAAKSLRLVSEDFILDVSHMGIISALVDELKLSSQGEKALLDCIGAKNLHGIDSVCFSEGIDPEKAKTLKALVAMKGSVSEMLEILQGTACYSDAVQLADALSALGELEEKVRVDFSVTDDMKYYSGIVFKGFVKGIPTSVLSGGRYDNLMRKLGKESGAIGFAVYLDLLGELEDENDEYDVDALVLYDDTCSSKELLALTDALAESGNRVLTARQAPDGLKYKELIDKRGGMKNGNA